LKGGGRGNYDGSDSFLWTKEKGGGKKTLPRSLSKPGGGGVIKNEAPS